MQKCCGGGGGARRGPSFPPPPPLVGEGLAHGLGDVLGADLEEVQQLLGLAAAGHAAHRHAGHHHAGLLPHGGQHRLAETTWGRGGGGREGE